MTTETQCEMPGIGWGHCEAIECINPKRSRTVSAWQSVIPEEQVKPDQQMQKARFWENPMFICPRPVRSTDPADYSSKEETP